PPLGRLFRLSWSRARAAPRVCSQRRFHSPLSRRRQALGAGMRLWFFCHGGRAVFRRGGNRARRARGGPWPGGGVERPAGGGRGGWTAVRGVADGANLGGMGKVDAIVLLVVVEPLPQPRETIALCCQHLNPGGIVVITTGDFGSTVARSAGARWRLMTPPQHL